MASRLDQARGLARRDPAARRDDRADATRPLPEDGRRDASRGHGHDGGFRRRGAALPGPSRPDRRTRHADLAAARRADQRVGRGAAGPAVGGQPKVVGIMCRNHRGFVEALVAANRIGSDVVLLNTSFAGPAMAEVVNREGVDAVDLRRGVHRDGGPRAGRQTGRHPHRGLGRRSPARADRRETHHRPRSGSSPQRTGRKGKMILLTSGTTGTSQGRQAVRRRRRNRHAQGDPGPHAVAGRGDDRDRRADVPRVGFLAVDLRRVDGLHGGHPAQVRPRGDAGPRRPPPGDGPRRGAGDVRPHHGPARRRPKPLQRQAPFASPRLRVRGCGPTSSPRSWTSSAT